MDSVKSTSNQLWWLILVNVQEVGAFRAGRLCLLRSHYLRFGEPSFAQLRLRPKPCQIFQCTERWNSFALHWLSHMLQKILFLSV